MNEVKTRNATTVGLSPKTIAASSGAALLGVVFAVLNLVQDNPALLGSLPPMAQTLLLVLVPPALVAVATYRAQLGEVGIPEADLPVVVDAPVRRGSPGRPRRSA